MTEPVFPTMKNFSCWLLLLTILGLTPALADHCYLCGRGSAEHCKHYCRYQGPNTFENRHKCQEAGCKVSGAASYPTAVNYKVCTVSQAPDEENRQVVIGDSRP